MIKTIEARFETFLRERHLFHSPARWLVAVSGGIDSVVLCQLCSSFHIPFAIAHCNFQLRGAESERDRQFTEALAAALGVPFFVKEMDTRVYMEATGASVQVAARELRYAWFRELLEMQNYQLLATAHHANDNLETVLMHFFRGTGIRGLRGIQPVQGRLIRPLLQVPKDLILAYAAAQGLSWVEDSSNSTSDYTRNEIRNNIIPLFEKVIPRQSQGFEKTLEMLAETELVYNEAIESYKRRLLEYKGVEIYIPVLKLSKCRPLRSITYEIAREYDFTAAQTGEILALLESDSGKYVASSTHRIIRNRAWLIIAPLPPEAASEHLLIEAGDKKIQYREGVITVEKFFNKEPAIPHDPNAALLDAKELHFPLILRPWKQGDYFYPLGLGKKKKIARFLIDQKISKTAKEKVWVIESNKKILWVIGYRIDDRFKVEQHSQNLLRLFFKSAAIAGA